MRHDNPGSGSVLKAETSDAVSWEHQGRPVSAVAGERARPLVPARLTLLNAFALSHEGIDVLLSVPAQRLLAFLALQDHPLLREYVAATLWLDSTQEHAAGSLRSALFRLRQSPCELVEATSGRLRLSPRLVVDVRRGVAWAREILDPTSTPGHLDGSGVGFAGDILPDWYDEWVVLERERFRELRVHALEALCARLTSVGRFGQAMEAAQAAVQGEPLRESAHRAVIGVHLAEGNWAKALESYRLFRARLQHEYGLTPSARMEELFREIGPR